MWLIIIYLLNRKTVELLSFLSFEHCYSIGPYEVLFAEATGASDGRDILTRPNASSFTSRPICTGDSISDR